MVLTGNEPMGLVLIGHLAITMSESSNGGSNSEPQQRSTSRFESRWHLIAAGLSNLWRFGDLELPAASGRLLLRGPNGTGKTTALEALAPYLLDLNAARMSAGKARTTTLSSLMREGAGGKRRQAYAWLTFAEGHEGVWSFGVRIQYSDGAAPPIKAVPFCVRGRPLHELRLYGPGRSALTIEQFTAAVVACDGQVFKDDDAYIRHLASRVFNTPNPEDVVTLATRLREVRNPTMLGDVSPQAAATALRESLPGVAEDVITATAEALAESDATRAAFKRDSDAAEVLAGFRDDWCAHATDVVTGAYESARAAADVLRSQTARLKTLESAMESAATEATAAKERAALLDRDIETARTTLLALENLPAYRDAGRLKDLKEAADAKQRTATTAGQAMQSLAQSTAQGCTTLARTLEDLREDLEEQRNTIKATDSTADDGMPLLAWTIQPRAQLRAGKLVVDPGPAIVIHGDVAGVQRSASVWRSVAQQHAQRSANATLSLTDYKTVDTLQKYAAEREKKALDAEGAAEAAAVKAASAEAEAQTAARDLVEAMRTWTLTHPLLTAARSPIQDVEAMVDAPLSAWSVDDVDQLRGEEASQVLASCESWARRAIAHAENLAGDLRAQSKQQIAGARKLRDEAHLLREEAIALRSGRLLPLPRPSWAGEGDDTIALGAALDWQADFEDPRARALLEAAIAASGLLGAHLTHDGAATRYWRLEPTGPVVGRNLSTLIAVDHEHPLASIAAAALARVEITESAHAATDERTTPLSLCIGLDGTFSAGVLRGRVPGADDSTSLPTASHIGARQRRAAALARADWLDEQATELEGQAAIHDATAGQLRVQADDISAQAKTVPSREALRAAESHRVALSRLARESRDNALTLQRESARATSDFEREYEAWSQRTRNRGLPAGLDDLKHVEADGKAREATLRMAAALLAGKLADRLDRVLARHDPDETSRTLTRIESDAQDAFRRAAEAEVEVQTLEEMAGVEIADVLRRHQKTQNDLSALQRNVQPAQEEMLRTAQASAQATSHYFEGERKLREEAKPNVTRQFGALCDLLSVPGVQDAVLDGPRIDDDDALLKQVEAALRGRRTLKVKSVLQRADEARTQLAGIWALDPGENHRELLTYVLTYRDEMYTPIAAAAHADTLRVRAERALAESEERALREFVIGRLPGAIRNAWVRLHDWIRDVNRKMRAAEASSGVGVQVHASLRDDLPPAVRTVYELSCKKSAIERSSEDEGRLAAALQSLLAVEGESMQQRVAVAVDIREWVEVHYEVTRPGGKTQRWNSRTGLSGGERRLVVLAPMLAAVAAAYDGFGPKALRLVTLDEVPAEVDDRGREGLARYIAELDLDLICTSYLWDGCPGAWDGIDAHDLEAGADGTVVAFPMLVRGTSRIPEVTGTDGKLLPMDRLS